MDEFRVKIQKRIGIVERYSTALVKTIDTYFSLSSEFIQQPSYPRFQKCVQQYKIYLLQAGYIISKLATTQDNEKRRGIYAPISNVVFETNTLLTKSIKFLVLFAEKAFVLDAHSAEIFDMRIKTNDCNLSYVYVETQIFDFINEKCRELEGGKLKEKLCSSLTQFINIKKDLDNLEDVPILTLKRYIQCWGMFVEPLCEFVFSNYIPMYNKPIVQCFERFIDQQIQLVIDIYKEIDVKTLEQRKKKELEIKF